MMRFMHLKSHWTPEDAHTAISLLDELRDAIWAVYGDDIRAYCRKEHLHSTNDLDHSIPDDDNIAPF